MGGPISVQLNVGRVAETNASATLTNIDVHERRPKATVLSLANNHEWLFLVKKCLCNSYIIFIIIVAFILIYIYYCQVYTAQIMKLDVIFFRYGGKYLPTHYWAAFCLRPASCDVSGYELPATYSNIFTTFITECTLPILHCNSF